MSFNDSSIEPKNIFLGLLINRLAIIEEIVYDMKDYRRGLTAMLAMVDLLDETSQNQLKDQRKKITDMQDGNLSKEEIHKIFSQITMYLHKTYLQEVSLGLIPASSLAYTKPEPAKEAIPVRLSSKLG